MDSYQTVVFVTIAFTLLVLSIMAIFCGAIDMLMDKSFLPIHWFLLTQLLALILCANTVINYGMLTVAKRSNEDACYCGASLAQAVEFDYIVGLKHQLIDLTTDQHGIGIMTLPYSLALFWQAL